MARAFPLGPHECARSRVQLLNVPAGRLVVAPRQALQPAPDEIRLETVGRKLTVGVAHLHVHQRSRENEHAAFW